MKNFIFVILIALVCLVAAAPAEAAFRRGNVCSSGSCALTYSTTYQYPLIEETVIAVPVPVLVPAFQFQYVPAVPAVAVPTIPAPVMPAPAAAPTPASQGNNTDIKALARAVLAEIQASQDDGPPVAIMDFGATPRVADGISVLSNRCAACHTGPASKAGVQIFTAAGAFNNAVDRQRIKKAIDENRMPLNMQTRQAYALTPQEKALVHQSLGN